MASFHVEFFQKFKGKRSFREILHILLESGIYL